jgi:hypothetical protein
LRFQTVSFTTGVVHRYGVGGVLIKPKTIDAATRQADGRHERALDNEQRV